MIKRFSTEQGAKLDKLAQSVKQFSADVAARIKANGVNDVYFREIYIGYLADVAAATEKKQEGETKEEHARRLFVAAANKFAAMTDEEKAETYIYKEMAAASSLFGLFRDALPVIERNGARVFAKEAKIAVSVASLTAEAAKEYEKAETAEGAPKYEKAVFMYGEEPREYFIRFGEAERISAKLTTAARYRRRKFGQVVDTFAAYFVNDGAAICTMIQSDKTKWRDLSPILSAACQQINIEAREKAQAAEAAAKAERARAAKVAAFITTGAAAEAEKLAAIQAKAEKAAKLTAATADKLTKAAKAKQKAAADMAAEAAAIAAEAKARATEEQATEAAEAAAMAKATEAEEQAKAAAEAAAKVEAAAAAALRAIATAAAEAIEAAAKAKAEKATTEAQATTEAAA